MRALLRGVRGSTPTAGGHATVDDALDLAEAGGVGRLVVIHHSPARIDAAMAEVEARLAAAAARVPAMVGGEGDWVEV